MENRADSSFRVYSKLRAALKDLKVASQPRDMCSDKGDNGRVMLIAGSANYHGAPVLASNAAYNTLASLRIGAGYAVLFVPKNIQDTVRGLSPNLIVKILGKNRIGEGSIRLVEDQIPKSDSLVIGMGLGRNADTLNLAGKIIRHALMLNKKIVIDADAIYAVKRLKYLGENVIITPQDREFSELYGKIPDKYSISERIKAAVSLSKRLRGCVLLKGHETIITNGKQVKIVLSHSSALATMGTGDVLAGIIGGYAATGTSIFQAGVAGAFLHARIGDLLANEKGTHILAGDVVERIPSMIRSFDKNSKNSHRL